MDSYPKWVSKEFLNAREDIINGDPEENLISMSIYKADHPHGKAAIDLIDKLVDSPHIESSIIKLKQDQRRKNIRSIQKIKPGYKIPEETLEKNFYRFLYELISESLTKPPKIYTLNKREKEISFKKIIKASETIQYELEKLEIAVPWSEFIPEHIDLGHALSLLSRMLFEKRELIDDPYLHEAQLQLQDLDNFLKANFYESLSRIAKEHEIHWTSKIKQHRKGEANTFAEILCIRLEIEIGKPRYSIVADITDALFDSNINIDELKKSHRVTRKKHAVLKNKYA